MTRRFRAPPASQASDKAVSPAGGGREAHGAAPPAHGGASAGGRVASSRTPEGHVVVAEFGRAHGVRGEVRLKSWTADPAAVAGYAPLLLADGRPISLASLRPAPGGEPDMFIVAVEGVSDRSGAEALARQRVCVPRTQLPELEDEDEFYLADLVGLTVEHECGDRLGDVVAVHDFGAGDVIEVRPPANPENPRRATAMVAFTRDFVPVVDIGGGRLVVSVNPFAKDSDEAEQDAPVAREKKRPVRRPEPDGADS